MEAQQPGDSADRYTYDAPSHVMLDFGDSEDNADQWFDLLAAPDNGEVDKLTTPLRVPKPFDGGHNEDLPKAVVSPMVQAVPTTEPTLDIGGRAAPEAQSNIVTSWGNGKPAAAPSQARKKNVPAQPRRVSKRIKLEASQAVSTPPVKKKRRVVPTPKRTGFRYKRRSSTGVKSARQSGAAATSTRSSVRLKTRPPAPPSTSSANQPKSTEQQELARIEALQKEVAEQRKRNEASYKAALAGSHVVKKQVLSTTVPKEFHFYSDSRLKNGTDVPEGSYKEVDFTSQLRKHPSSPLKAHKGSTVPKPFNLSAGSKRKLEETDGYVSMAQQIERFQKRTPTRYHLRSRQSQERGPSPVKNEKPKVTHPHTPQLMTRQRSRPTVVKSSAEIEAEELEKMQQFKFKALELNRKILESALVPKKPAVKEPTQPEGFQLEVEKRLQERNTTKKNQVAENEDHTFHSRPLPTRILEEVVGVPEKKVLNPTIPESPAFALKNRIRVERKEEEVKHAAPVKAHPVPHYVPFQLKPVSKSHVEVCPFSFEQREQERRAQKEKRLEELRNEEVPKFKARLLPDFHDVHLPEKKVPEPTKPVPFKLMVDERGAVKSERWEQQVKEELKQQSEAACFKARPNAIVHSAPFVPKKENRSILANPVPPAAPEGFQLSTERRAKERLEFERALKEKEALRAQMEVQEAREQEEREKEEVARLRQEQVHKAQPIRRYKPIEPKHSETKLTVPHSPKFSDRFRL